MPDKSFLEEYPLYRRFKFVVPSWNGNLAKPAIKMSCPVCESDQTYNIAQEYNFILQKDARIDNKESTIVITYVCTSCGRFLRHFLIYMSGKGNFIMKVGQYPSWDISGDKNIEDLLDKHADYYKKGLICESQSYGIGAFAYYRRIVEETIDQLLNEVSGLLSGEEAKHYAGALEQVKKTRMTIEKIDLIKDLLPPILRPGGYNPLSALHSALSEGLHAESDEDCMKYAAAVREVLVFLTSQVSATKQASLSFTDGMKKLLDKKQPSNDQAEKEK